MLNKRFSVQFIPELHGCNSAELHGDHQPHVNDVNYIIVASFFPLTAQSPVSVQNTCLHARTQACTKVHAHICTCVHMRTWKLCPLSHLISIHPPHPLTHRSRSPPRRWPRDRDQPAPARGRSARRASCSGQPAGRCRSRTPRRRAA